MYACICKNLTEKKLTELIKEAGCKSVPCVRKKCGAGSQCSKCVPVVRRLLRDIREEVRSEEKE